MKNGKWNPSRVLAALGKIGYHPVSAILDIADNSVSAHATEIAIKIEYSKENKTGKGRRKTVIDSIAIIDNGRGLNEDGVDNALSLGSSSDYYDEGTLSKFGMGLKSASSSLGRRLEIISFTESSPAVKAVLDQDLIHDEYVYQITAADAVDLALFRTGQPSGTIIRITKIHHDAMPSVAEIIDGLKKRAGVVYYYYLVGKISAHSSLSLTINDEAVEPFDPLFVESISADDPNLVESEWSGTDVRWICHPQKIQLDTSGTKIATVSITQLPHPPSVGDAGQMSQKACRDYYMIGAGNYGFYIYRNGRLISWADSLDLVGQDQDLYSFRGRVEISSDADEVLNIDVTKSRIHLSEIAKDQLIPILQEAKKKSIAAWDHAKKALQRKVGEDPHNKMGEELDKAGGLLEKDDSIDEEVAAQPEREKLQQRRKKAVQQASATPAESEKLVTQGQRVQYVTALENNQLWERAFDPEHGLIVRVNQSHRFYKDLLEPQQKNSSLVMIMDLILFGLARGEYSLVYKSDYDTETIEKIMTEFREYVGNDLSEIIRKLNLTGLIDG